jgi:hypothetical protein
VVREYKANYARELSKLPALLRTTSATPDLPGAPGKPGASGRPGRRSTPSPTPLLKRRQGRSGRRVVVVGEVPPTVS